MKQILKTFMLSLFITYSVQAYSQYSTSYLSYEYIEILSYSIKITYSTSGSYKPPTTYDFYGNALGVMQQRYDANREAVSIAYGNVWNLELINKDNKAKLSKYKTKIKYEIDNNISSWNFGITANAEKAIDYISFPFRDESIKDEIKLLQNCQTELARIKYKEPDNYIYSKRYKSIKNTLELLENCEPSKIKYLSWENTELNNNSNYSYNTTDKSNNEFTYYNYAEYDQSTDSWTNIKDEKNIFIIKDDQLYRNSNQISSNMVGTDVTYGDNYTEYIFFRNGGMSPYHYRFYKDSKAGLHVYFMGKLQYAYYNENNSSNEANKTTNKPTKRGGNVFWIDEWCTETYTYTNPNESIKIDCITESETQILVRFTATPSKKYSSGWWVNFSPNAYILLDSKKYYLEEYGGIPISPEKHYFKSINDKISFTLYFEKAYLGNKKFDIIEGVEGGFNFYNIYKTN